MDDRSTDGTRRDPRAPARGENRRLTVVHGVEPPEGWLGKPHALFEGASRASGDSCCFADADVRYAPAGGPRGGRARSKRNGLDLLAFFPRLEMSRLLGKRPDALPSRSPTSSVPRSS